MFVVASSPRLQRLIQVVVGVSIAAWLLHAFVYNGPVVPLTLPSLRGPERPRHPIDDLREYALRNLSAIIAKETTTLQAAEHAYLERRGRRPPPAFDKWFRYAQEHNAIIIEDFFDRIYDDLNPFWAIPPVEIRRHASEWFFRLSIRNGNVTKRMDHERPWLNLWAHMIEHVAEYLPDLDISINEMDESRMVAPWEDIDKYMRVESKSRRILPLEEMVRDYSQTVIGENETVPAIDFGWSSDAPYWNLVVKGCAPTSPARMGYQANFDYREPPPLTAGQPEQSYQGYVQNWTFVKSPCDNPELQQLHGTFVEPVSISTTNRFFSMFGGSKLPMNNEILLPAAMYWTDDPFYSGGAGHGGPWRKKFDKLVWRGAASGGRNNADNWTRFQRHRFVSMMNGTTVSRVEREELVAPNFVLPQQDAYHLANAENRGIGTWLKQIADAAVVHLLCFPDPQPPFCEYTNPWFKVEKTKPMQEQYNYKYLPDVDGNSFSGRYRGFLGSTSLPIKATIYDEWHDSRLIPWVHFVPMHNTFIDIYGILEYFLGTEKREGHDDVAKAIAMDGKNWAERVLRREDMVIYVFRLLLEYARICDEERDRLGWSSE